jgi:hypothetical protein
MPWALLPTSVLVNLWQSGKADDFTEARQQLTPTHRSRPQTVNSSRDGPSD